MEQKIAASTVLNMEILRGLQAAGLLENVETRYLIDLAKIGGFATVCVDNEQLINKLERLRQMDQGERLTAVLSTEIQAQ